jgi:hypothetical protein
VGTTDYWADDMPLVGTTDYWADDTLVGTNGPTADVSIDPVIVKKKHNSFQN